MKLEFIKHGRVQIRDAEIIFKNFQGTVSDYNRGGAMKFSVIIDEEYVKGLKDDGWNVKLYESKNEKFSPFYYLEVELRYNNYPPKVFAVIRDTKRELTEDTVGELDFADILKGDMILNGSKYDVNGRQGTKAYLNKLYATLDTDELDDIYNEYSNSNFNVRNTDETEDDVPF